MKKVKRREYLIKFGSFKIKKGPVCILALVMILVVSSAGFITTTQTDSQQDLENIQTRVVINFGDFSEYNEILVLDRGATAESAFREVANITTIFTQNGNLANSISLGNFSATQNETHQWVFYINGGITFKGIDRYEVRNGDVIELRFEKEPY